jgi:hypothetical protein
VGYLVKKKANGKEEKRTGKKNVKEDKNRGKRLMT